MLKKNDLAKQFELLVQQEIKNYNDSLSSIFQTINELRESIHEVHEEALENYAVLHSFQTDLGIKFQNFEERFNEFVQKVDRQIYDQQIINERNAYIMNEMSQAIHLKIQSDAFFMGKIKEFENDVREEARKSVELHHASAKAMNELIEWTRKSFQKHKDEINSRPPPQDPLLRHLDEKLESHTVDVEGLLKELRIMRKDIMIGDKKFEAIFMILDKLKLPEVTP
jgi:methyl-accepting chemotaxis protein